MPRRTARTSRSWRRCARRAPGLSQQVEPVARGQRRRFGRYSELDRHAGMIADRCERSVSAGCAAHDGRCQRASRPARRLFARREHAGGKPRSPRNQAGCRTVEGCGRQRNPSTTAAFTSVSDAMNVSQPGADALAVLRARANAVGDAALIAAVAGAERAHEKLALERASLQSGSPPRRPKPRPSSPSCARWAGSPRPSTPRSSSTSCCGACSTPRSRS